MVAIVFTLPSTGQNRYMAWDETAQESVLVVECSGSQAIHQLSTARLYFYPLTGGGWRLAQEHGVPGREGQADSFVVDPGPGGHYYLTVTNPVAESCASPLVYVPGSIVTGVGSPDDADRSPITKTEIFDVRGRLCRSLVRSGIYFRRTTYANGHTVTKRVVLLK